jgi:hypothetical protein
VNAPGELFPVPADKREHGPEGAAP